MNEPLLMEPKDAAPIIGIPLKQFYEKLKRGHFPEGVVIRMGRSIYVSRRRLHEWLASPLGKEGGVDELHT